MSPAKLPGRHLAPSVSSAPRTRRPSRRCGPASAKLGVEVPEDERAIRTLAHKVVAAYSQWAYRAY
eukprot:7518038-Pyramimonas_sp.AAC.2